MRYFIECTYTYHTKLNTGIQRVVRNIVRCAPHCGLPGEFVPVIFQRNSFFALDGPIPYPHHADAGGPPMNGRERLRRAKLAAIAGLRGALAKLIPFKPVIDFIYAPRTEWGLSRIVYLPVEWLQRDRLQWQGVDIAPGDVLILLDSSWNYNLWRAVDECRRRGASVVIVMYDLIPATHPQVCVPPLVAAFHHWLKQAAPRTDAAIAISQTVANEFAHEFPKITGRQLPASHISYFWLGSELDGESGAGRPVPPAIADLCTSGRPTYLYVSTIEPRKNHDYALDAFDLLWQQGIDANFLIVGRYGWKCEDFVQRVQRHPQYGRMLHMLNGVGDSDLAWLYAHAQGLVFTSIAEGFGLPIVEGLQRGLPVFASDIPVFREVGREGVLFVDLDKPQSLADALASHVRQGAPRLAEPVAWLSWEQSTRQFFERINSCLQHDQERLDAVMASAAG